MEIAEKLGTAPQTGGLSSSGVADFAMSKYSPAEFAGIWSRIVDGVRNIFEDEPGVLVIDNQQPTVWEAAL
jgi:hypothetical protein